MHIQKTKTQETQRQAERAQNTETDKRTQGMESDRQHTRQGVRLKNKRQRGSRKVETKDTDLDSKSVQETDAGTLHARRQLRRK